MKNTTMPRRRDLDLLRVMAMAAVCYLHTAAGALRGDFTVPLWQFSNVLTTLATAAVPLFFMLSGGLLLGEDSAMSLSRLFRHRLPKIVVPLAAWSGVVVLVAGLRQGWSAAGALLLPVYGYPVCMPYWFIYALVPMYLLSPLLRVMVAHLTERQWRYLLGLWVVLTLGVRTLRGFFPPGWQALLTEHGSLNVNLVGGYLGYFLLGAYLARTPLHPPKRALWVVIVVDALVMVLGTWRDTLSWNAYSERFKDYLSLFTLVLAVAIYLLVGEYQRGRATGRVLGTLSTLSFGVYLAHPMAIPLMSKLFLYATGQVADSIWAQMVVYGGVVAGCLAGAWLLSWIKPLCYLTTGQAYSSVHPPRARALR